MIKNKNLLDNGLFFVTITWFSSRLFICALMLLLAPLLPAPNGGVAATLSWDVFSAWDSKLYEIIATYGYDYDANGQLVSYIAFFPLFPLVIRSLLLLGLPFQVAGTLVNNLAFLGASAVLYHWINERYGISAARWTTAVLVWCPLSLFGTVIYSEGLYLLLSTAALQAFEKQKYGLTAFWGAFATATRPTGIALFCSFLLTTFLERRGTKAFIGSLASGGGLFLFSLYCQIKYDDALAFLHAQKAWRPTFGINWMRWSKMVMQIVIGTTNWKSGYIRDPWHPILFVIIITSGYILWRFRKQLNAAKVVYGFLFLGLLLWLLAGDPLINTVMILGGAYLLWFLRTQLSRIVLVYGLCGIAMLLVSGSTISLNRLAYGIVSLSIALGVLLPRYPLWRDAVICLFAIVLASFSIRFAQDLWVA